MKKPVDLFFGALAVFAAAFALFRSTKTTTPSPTGRAAATALTAPAAVAGSEVGRRGGPFRAVASSSRETSTAVDLAKAVAARIKEHNVVMIAASLSYYAILSVFPAAIAAVSIYGLVSDPIELQAQLDDLSDALPEATGEFISAQLRNIVEGSSSSLGFATAISILFALWSASAGTKALISGTNIAYGESETRSFLALRAVAYGLTLMLIVGLMAAVVAVTALPQILSAVGLGDEAQTVLNISRFPLVFLLVVIGLGTLYKLAPNRPASMTKFVNVGGIVAAILWVIATVGFSVYVNNFGKFGETYGTLAGLIVLMLWFFVSGLIVLAGAELNSELEVRKNGLGWPIPDPID